MIFASAISASFIPVFVEYLQKKGRKEAFSLANPLYYDDFDRYAFDDASGDGVCKAADASDWRRAMMWKR